MVSRSGVLLKLLTAIFQFCMSGSMARREMGCTIVAQRKPRSQMPPEQAEALFLSLGAPWIGQCDLYHSLWSHASQSFFTSYLKHLHRKTGDSKFAFNSP